MMDIQNGTILVQSTWVEKKGWVSGIEVPTRLDDEAVLFERFTAPSRAKMSEHTTFSLEIGQEPEEAGLVKSICLYTRIDQDTRQRETWYLVQPWVSNAFQIFATLAYKCVSAKTRQIIESPVEWKGHVEDWAVFEGSRRQLDYYEAIAAILQFDSPEGCIETSPLDTARDVIELFKNPRKRLSHPCPPKLPDLKLAK